TQCTVANKPCRTGTTDCSTGLAVCNESGSAPDGMGCGQGMVCASGACVACMSGQACTPTNPCHTGALDCSGSMPSCTDKGMNVAPGTSCGQDKVCGATGTCDACVAGMSCPVAGKPCRTGATSCSTGGSVCGESGNAMPGTSCGAGMVCNGSGGCVACNAGDPCTPTNPCHQGTLSCTAGAAICVDSNTNKAPGTTCGAAQSCSSGMKTAAATCNQGVACSCPQPSAANLLRNPGFDTDLSSWVMDAGPGGFDWKAGTTMDANGVYADADACPFSGAAFVSAPTGTTNQRISQCVPV